MILKTFEKFSEHKGREPFKKGDKIKFDPNSQFASDDILTVIEDEGQKDYACVWAHPAMGALVGNPIMYKKDGEIITGEFGYLEDLPEGKEIVRASKDEEEILIDKEDIIAMCYKDYIFVLAE